jgi:hypothetical protein
MLRFFVTLAFHPRCSDLAPDRRPTRPAATNPRGSDLFLTSLLPGLITSLPNLCTLPTKRDPLFSIVCALFLIHNSAHLFSFVATAHSLPKAPGGRGRIGPSNQIFSNQSLSDQIPEFPSPPLTPIESHSFMNAPSNPFRMTFFRKTPGDPPLPSCTSLPFRPVHTLPLVPRPPIC